MQFDHVTGLLIPGYRIPVEFTSDQLLIVSTGSTGNVSYCGLSTKVREKSMV